jgi:Fe-S oxidoreductase
LPQVFSGGDVVTGPGVVIDALAAGRRAAMAIDRYLRGEARSVAGETVGSHESRLKVDMEGIALKDRMAMPLRPLEQRQGFDEIELGFSEEQSVQEAERCIRCECNLCVKSCEFLKSACNTPTELAEKLKNGHFREMPKIPYSCNLCGLCRRLCPEELDIGRVCLDLRRQLVEEGLGPLPGHKAVISEQEWVASDAFFTVFNGTDSGTSQRLFFPGCSLSAYSPDLVARTYEYLQRKLPGIGIILGCCGAPSYMIGDQTRFQNMMGRITTQMEKSGTSELILACPDCYHTFRENAPDIQARLVYELMIERGLPEAARAQSGKSFSIHDSCKTRYESGIQDSVRAIAEKLGYSIKEPEFSRDKTRCCGMGGMVSYVDVKLVNKVTMVRAKEMSQDVLTYCASCRNSFALVGKPSVHILDVIFGSELEKTKRRSPVIGEARRKNQSELKARLSEIVGTSAR